MKYSMLTRRIELAPGCVTAALLLGSILVPGAAQVEEGTARTSVQKAFNFRAPDIG